MKTNRQVIEEALWHFGSACFNLWRDVGLLGIGVTEDWELRTTNKVVLERRSQLDRIMFESVLSILKVTNEEA